MHQSVDGRGQPVVNHPPHEKQETSSERLKFHPVLNLARLARVLQVRNEERREFDIRDGGTSVPGDDHMRTELAVRLQSPAQGPPRTLRQGRATHPG
jgi:hypothetical protein